MFACFPIFLAAEAPSNLAENQPTWQTSTSQDGESSRTVDVGLSTLYGHGSCMHTGLGPVVWTLDLGGMADIYYAEVLK